jgi:hypothetical protein
MDLNIIIIIIICERGLEIANELFFWKGKI